MLATIFWTRFYFLSRCRRAKVGIWALYTIQDISSSSSNARRSALHHWWLDNSGSRGEIFARKEFVRESFLGLKTLLDIHVE